MSSGVARVFKAKFGRPQDSDWDVSKSRLIHQQFKNGPTVYSLVTKKEYKHKPLDEDYDEAFYELIKDFKTRNLKQMVCSTMGCNRDHISLEHFASKIVEFQIETGASVTIATFKENSKKRVSKLGLSYEEFVERLQENILNSLNFFPTVYSKVPLKITRTDEREQDLKKRTASDPISADNSCDEGSGSFQTSSHHITVTPQLRTAELQNDKLRLSLSPGSSHSHTAGEEVVPDQLKDVASQPQVIGVSLSDHVSQDSNNVVDSDIVLSSSCPFSDDPRV